MFCLTLNPRVSFFCALVFLSLSGLAQFRPAAVDHTPSAVIFETGSAAQVIRVAGPDQLRFDLHFEASETPLIDVVDADGEVLADGLYVYELSSSDATTTASGSFRVQNGEIIDPFEFEAAAFANNTTSTSGSLVVNTSSQNGGVLVNSSDGSAVLHVQNDNGDPSTNSAATTPLQISNDGALTWRMANTHRDKAWSFSLDNSTVSNLKIKEVGAAFDNLILEADGDAKFEGNIFAGDGLEVFGDGTFTGGIEAGELHVSSSDSSAEIHIENDNGDSSASAASTPLRISNDGAVTWRMDNTHRGIAWSFSIDNSVVGNLKIKETGAAFDNLVINSSGGAILEGTLTQTSSRHMKQDFEAVDTEDVLARLISIPVTEWSYQRSSDQRHMGVMAQDFYLAFGLGQNECGIGSIDTSGVAFASIQELNKQLEQKENRIQDLESRLKRLETLLLEQ